MSAINLRIEILKMNYALNRLNQIVKAANEACFCFNRNKKKKVLSKKQFIMLVKSINH